MLKVSIVDAASNFNPKCIYLINALVQLNDCSERDSRIVFFAEHGMGFTGSGGAIHEDGAVEATEDDVDEILGRTWKMFQKYCGFNHMY